MTTRLSRSALSAATVLLASLLGAGCDKACSLVAVLSQVTLTLHLPPEKDVAMPETVTVCQEPKCRAGVLPPVGAPGAAAGFNLTSSPAMGLLSLAPGSVRVLLIEWPLEQDGAVNPKDPRNEYRVDVLDAKGVTTGGLASSITYQHVTDSQCGVDAWSGSASD